MVQSGYVHGVPDTEYWMAEVRRGIAFRRKYAKQAEWARWRTYYRGDWPRDILPVNLYFRMLRTIVPRIYFRNPSISITNTRPGAEFEALAQIIERIDNKLIRTMRVKQSIKTIIQHAWMFGTGAGVIGLGSKTQLTLDEFGQNETQTLAKGKLIQRFDYAETTEDNMPWFQPCHTGTLIVPAGLANFSTGRWFAQWVQKPLYEVQTDPRLSNTKDLKSSRNPEAFVMGQNAMDTPQDMVDLVIIRDKMFKKVFMIAPYSTGSKVLYFSDDAMQINGRAGMYPLVFNEDDEVFWGVPDSQILDPQQRELNEIRTLQAKHRRLSIVKLFMEDNSIAPEEIDKMTNEDVLAVVKAKNINGIKPMVLAQEPDSLRYAGREVMDDVRENLGFSRNQSGNYGEGSGGGASRASATEASIVQAASEIRVDERRDMCADLITNVFTDINTMIFSAWGQEQVVSILGPNGLPIWVAFKPQALKGVEYLMDIDPDSAAPQTHAVRSQSAIQTYSLFKDNPLIDPAKLTKNTLRELHGVEFDDMMRDLGVMRDGAGGNPSQPLSMEQYLSNATQNGAP